MADANSSAKRNLGGFAFKALKAAIKAVLLCVIYFVLSQLLAPVSTFVPGIQQMIETFFIIYIVLMIIGNLTSGTIYQHFFNGAKALFVIGYLLLSLGGGVFNASFENMSLIVNLRMFLTIAVLLSLLGLARTVLQAINYMSEKAEITPI
jgi:uncharacterized ion transporter superfamily protein YfcC